MEGRLTKFKAALLAGLGYVGALAFFMVLLAITDDIKEAGGQTGNEGCPNPRRVAAFSGTENQITPQFQIIGNTFRISGEAQGTEPQFPAVINITPVDTQGAPVGTTVSISENGPFSENILEGPGTFALEIEAFSPSTYTITVDDCTGTPSNNNNGNNNNKNKKNKKNNGGGNNNNHKKHHHHHGSNNPFNNPLRQYARNNGQYNGNNGQYNGNNGFNQQSENTFGSNSVNSTQSTGENTFGQQSTGNNPAGNGGASASSGSGGAEASTPGAVAKSGNPDQQSPVGGPQGDVVNDVSTHGPLPNTGGLTFLALALPVVGFLILGVAIVVRIQRSR